MRYTGPKVKLCRREGYNLFGTEKYNTNTDPKKKGRTPKLSEYGVQLRKKQAAKRQFGLSEKQFRRYYDRAIRMQGVTGDNFLHLLEMRFDNVVFRANFGRTIMQSRQAVNHSHFLVNGKKVNIPSYQMSVGDVISLKEKMKESTLYKSLLEEFRAFSEKNSAATLSQASWLTINPKDLTITVSGVPEKKDFDSMIDTQRIIEFYSK